MRIPQPPDWEPTTEFEEAEGSVVLALSNTDDEPSENVVAVIVEPVPDAGAATVFDDFTAVLEQILDEEGLPSDLTRTAGTLCGLPSETVIVAGAAATMGAAANALPSSPSSTLLVVAESGGDTYLIAVVQSTDPDNPTRRRDAETILTGFEVLPLTAVDA